MILDEESEEGSTAESSESEIDDSPSKRHNQKAKHIDYAYRKGKGKNTALDIESEDGQSSEVEDNEPSLENFKLPSETQRRNAKQKNTKHSSHAKYSTNHRVAKGRDSPLYADIKSSFSHADRPTIQRKRGVKRDRNPYEFEDESTEESADESSGAEMDASSSRASHSRIKGKRLEKPGRLSGASDNDSDIDEEVGRRAARAFSKANPVKNKYQTGNCKKLDKSNDLAVFRVKDLARQAVDGPTLSGDAPKVKAKSQNWNRKKIGKANDLTGGATGGSTLGGDALETDGRTARSTKHGSGDSMDEEDEEPEEPEIGHV
ncbi:hypothetical protein N7517_005960 [Penicillium concentricum]|uniref:Uncharacterized protein n=1 Tax=Penicillium concentricum TaxID=293559 RepID=A0A9W9SB69_9EURO|nr:uncharacterized protein N7517_005960 [Penicillium concentricum]KAJ5373954.1 hypothetical protein N7517_005960 [Penicillium concentricum]